MESLLNASLREDFSGNTQLLLLMSLLLISMGINFGFSVLELLINLDKNEVLNPEKPKSSLRTSLTVMAAFYIRSLFSLLLILLDIHVLWCLVPSLLSPESVRFMIHKITRTEQFSERHQYSKKQENRAAYLDSEKKGD